jgi:dTDP-4-amino-4,6-dideoxygalactose transaminase
VLCAKLPHLEAWNAARRKLAAAYARELDPDRARVVAELPGSRGVHHLMVVRVQERSWVQQTLAAAGVGTGIHYPTPCHLMAPYAAYPHPPLPVAERAATEILSLPMYPGLGLERVEQVAGLVNRAAGSRAA